MGYRRKILLLAFLVFIALAGAILGLEILSMRSSRRAVLQSRLQGYADMIEKSDDPSTIRELFPDDLRITVIDSLGDVHYDSFTESALGENHLTRPEVRDSREKGFGYSIRFSRTAGKELLYYAKSYPSGEIVRLALPFEVNLRHFFRPDAMAIVSVVLIFAVSLLLLMFLLQRYDTRTEQEERERVRKLKHQMTSNISHELKTPVSGMRGYLETLCENPDIDPKRRELYLRRCYSQSVRLSDLIRDISIINKMEEAPEMFSIEKVNLRSVCDSVLDEFAPSIKSSGIWVENEVDPGEEIYGNYNLLYSLFRNLVENSVKHAGKGVRIHVESDAEGNFVYYDTGKGVPGEHLEDIFGRFYRVDEGRSSDEGGSGLGLSIVRNAVLFHGGSISSSEHQGGGLEFRFSLRSKKNPISEPKS